MLEITKEKLANVHTYKKMQLSEIKAQIAEKLSQFKKFPDNLNLFLLQSVAHIPGGIFSSDTAVCLIITKDKFLHVFDSFETKEKPIYSYDLRKTIVKISDGHQNSAEVMEKKRKQSLIERIVSGNSFKIVFDTEHKAKEWVENVTNIMESNE